MSDAYEKKLEQFVEGRIFARLRNHIRNKADAHCDACGSLEPSSLFGLKEENSNRLFFVGSECLRQISQRGTVRRQFCREDCQAAFEREMAQRKYEQCQENCSDNTELPLQGIQRLDPLSHNYDNGDSPEPQVCLWETTESYLALVSVSHKGTWIWGIAEASRFEEVWECQGNGEFVLNRVPRERSRAIAECVG